MKETVESIMKWHEDTFPDSTIEGQRRKFENELEEWRASSFQDVTEIADMYIVACGIKRFNELDFMACLSIITWECHKNGITDEMLDDAVNKKMKINRKRKWSFENGVYQHKTEDKEEK